MADTIYCYPNSNTLRNRLNITDENELNNAERELTTWRDYEIRLNPVKGDFDFNHLKSIHKVLFNDLYEWAGKLRTVEISKGEQFCNSSYLQEFGDSIFRKIKKTDFLIGMSKADTIEKLAEYMGDINALHPFREGNGRTQRQFIECLAKVSGIELQFENTNATDMLHASKRSFYGDNSFFVKIFTDIAAPISIHEQQEFINNISNMVAKVFDDKLMKNEIPDRLVEFNVKPKMSLSRWKDEIKSKKIEPSAENFSKNMYKDRIERE